MERRYVVECFWPDVRPGKVEQCAARARVAVDQMRGEGRRVIFSGSILVPGDEVVFYLFTSDSEEAVREVCVRAAIPFERVLESIHSA